MHYIITVNKDDTTSLLKAHDMDPKHTISIFENTILPPHNNRSCMISEIFREI